MKKASIAVLVVVVAVVVGYRITQQRVAPAATSPAAESPSATTTVAEAHPSLLYGRIATVEGGSFEGRLRWGGEEEAFRGNYFNGAKKTNPWAVHVAPEKLPRERRPFQILGFEVSNKEHPVDLGRLFMSRFGDIARVESSGSEVRVTLKSGATFNLDRFSAGDFDDGVRVWDSTRGVVDLDSLRIRSIELLPSPRSGATPVRLHGTVHTPQGEFTGFLQWNREECLGSDELKVETADGELRLRFDTIRSVARRSPDRMAATLLDGREVLFSAAEKGGPGNRGIYVDDGRYGRVLVSWAGFDRVDFSPGGTSPAYTDFPVGGPLTGGITTRTGRRILGRLVYDLDESEVTETLDAPSTGVNYNVPFGLISSVVLPDPDKGGGSQATLTLHSGEELELERTGDLGKGNAGMLIFVDGQKSPEYVPWTDVARIDLNRPSAMYPPPGKR